MPRQCWPVGTVPATAPQCAAAHQTAVRDSQGLCSGIRDQGPAPALARPGPSLVPGASQRRNSRPNPAPSSGSMGIFGSHPCCGPLAQCRDKINGTPLPSSLAIPALHRSDCLFAEPDRAWRQRVRGRGNLSSRSGPRAEGDQPQSHGEAAMACATGALDQRR